MSSKYKPKVDPQLLQQLNMVGASQDVVQAVFQLKLPPSRLLDPEAVEAAVQTVLSLVQQEVGEEASEVNIFRNIGAFVVCAHAPFIRALMNKPEIASATANIQHERRQGS